MRERERQRVHNFIVSYFFVAIFRVVSAVLLFGNMEFKQERNSDQALLPDNTVAQRIGKLLGVSVTDFTKALLKPKIKTGREFTVRSQNKSQVSTCILLLNCWVNC